MLRAGMFTERGMIAAAVRRIRLCCAASAETVRRRDWIAAFKSAGILLVRYADEIPKPVWRGGAPLCGEGHLHPMK
ncbi:MAG: hypothetical protein E7458_09125 [Ruminococcaceae bacterium]|nr:hypothetical protein [Oscillospiraceae bacterium]